MLFVVTMEHTPDNCWARPEKEDVAGEWIAGIGETAESTGVDVHGAYATPSEHTFYFVLEADSFEDVTAFLGPPLLQDHDAHVAPVITLADAEEVVLQD